MDRHMGRSTDRPVNSLKDSFADGAANRWPTAADSLKFTPELTAMILLGVKTTTIRLEPKRLAAGDYAELMTRYDYERVEPFALALIECVETARLCDIRLDLPGHEPYPNRRAQLNDYRRYYGPAVMPDTEFTIYFFRVVARL